MFADVSEILTASINRAIALMVETESSNQGDESR
jgi:hypothetical protein